MKLFRLLFQAIFTTSALCFFNEVNQTKSQKNSQKLKRCKREPITMTVVAISMAKIAGTAALAALSKALVETAVDKVKQAHEEFKRNKQPKYCKLHLIIYHQGPTDGQS